MHRSPEIYSNVLFFCLGVLYLSAYTQLTSGVTVMSLNLMLMSCCVCDRKRAESCREPEDEASVQEESPEPGEGAGRLPQGPGELRGDHGLRRDRSAVPLESKNEEKHHSFCNISDVIITSLRFIHSVTDSVQCHGPPDHLRVLCLPGHLDEVRI